MVDFFATIKFKDASQSNNVFLKNLNFQHFTNNKVSLFLQGDSNDVYNSEDLLVFIDGEELDFSKMYKSLKYNYPSENEKNDSEKIADLYRKYGVSFFKVIEGKFRLLIYDVKKNNCFVLKDKLGSLPVYYHFKDNELLVSSNLDFIARSNTKNEIDDTGLALYMKYRFVPSPYCILKGVKKLCAGELLTINNKNCKGVKLLYKIHCKRTNIRDLGCNIIEAVNELKKYNNIGILLSGGLDSSIITSILSKAEHNNLITYSLGYEDVTKFDELQTAQKIAKELDVNQESVIIKNNQVLDLLNKFSNIIDEPLYSTVGICSLKLALSVDKNVDIITTGDGSDELFFSYKYVRDAINSKRNNYNLYFNGLTWLKGYDVQHFFNHKIRTEKILNKHVLPNSHKNLEEFIKEFENFKRFPEYHLARVNKVCSYYNIKTSLPFYNLKLIKYALGLNYLEFLKHEDPKFIIKQQLSNYTSETMIKSKKQPFTSPNKNWIEGPLNKDLYNIFNNDLFYTILPLEKQSVLELIKSYKGGYEDVSNVWGFYVVFKWVEQHINYFKKERK